MTITYPPIPVDKQYGSSFPKIPRRGLPSKEEMQKIMEAHRSLQPKSQENSSESFSEPVSIEFGITDVCVRKGGRRSWSYDDGPFDTADLMKTRNATRDFCFAPGVDDTATDDSKMTIEWETHGHFNVKSAKVELYCSGHDKPIWEQHYGKAWENGEAKDISEFKAEKDPSTKGYTFRGGIDWSEVKVKTDIMVDGEKAFPKGMLTTARSPYQLRVTVSGCTAKDDPQDGDKYAYPMTAWTYVHVLVHSIKLEAGKPEWLSTSRDDIHDDWREKVIGTRQAKEDNSGDDYGWEGEILAELAKKTTRLERGTYHPLYLESTLFNAGLRKEKDNDKSPLYEDWERYKDMWGQGPRIPIVATPTIRTCAGKATDTNVVDVCHGQRFLWDWVDDENDPEPRWLKATKTKTLGDAKKTIEYLEKVYDRCRPLKPSGSYNCPLYAGGKLGDQTNQPIFPKQDPKGDGNGSLPYEVKPCATRTWAVTSALDDAGKTGAVFHPSRFAGDCYTVNVYPYTPALDSTEPLDPTKLTHGSTGKFEVFRRVRCYHVVVGGLPGVDLRSTMRTVKARLASQVNLDLQVISSELDDNDYNELIKTTLEAYRKSVKGLKTVPYLPLCFEVSVKLDGAPAKQFFDLHSRAEYAQKIKAMFKDGTVRAALHKTLDDEAKAIDYPDDPNRTSEEQKAFMNEGLTGETGATIYQLHQESAKTKTKNQGKEDEEKVEVRPKLVYMLAKAGGAFKAGKSEQADGECTTKKHTLEHYQEARSCWGRAYVDAASTAKETIEVTFPGRAAVTLTYKKKGFARTLKDTLEAEDEQKLRDELIATGKTFDESQTLSITIKARQSSSNSRARVTHLKAFLDKLFDEELLMIDRKAVADSFLSANDYYATPKSYAAYWTKSLYPLDEFANAFIEKHSIKAGMILVHFNRVANLADTIDGKGVYGAAKLDWRDMLFGSFSPQYRESEEQIGLVKLQVPQAGVDTTDNDAPQKSPESVLIHEAGHALFLSDHSEMSKERVDAKKGKWVGANLAKHVLDDPCLMDYDVDTHQFCGLCMLRLRGWSWESFDNKGTGTAARVEFKLGDIDPLFSKGADTDEGYLARLQVLGLFNRPLWMGKQNLSNAARRDHFHFQRCALFSIAHAKKLLGSDIKTPENDPTHTPKALAKAIQDYLIEGGEKTLNDPEKQSKVRIYGGFTALFSNSDMELRCRQSGVELFADQPEEEYALGADRASVEGEFYEHNPALGTVPLSLQVTDVGGNPLSGVTVWLELLKPKEPAAYANGTQRVGGGKAFNTASGSAALHTDPKAYLDTNVAQHKPGAEDDPQAGNVHAELGGKRGLSGTAGDIHSLGPNGELPLFTMFDETPFSAPIDPSSKEPIPNTIALTTDPHGQIEVLFRPSRIGGDGYRLRASVQNPIPGEEPLGTAETCDLYVWRSVRVSRHVQVPNVETVKDLSPGIKKYLDKLGKSADALIKPLPELDLKHLSQELSKAYVELIVEPEAEKPEDLAGKHWGDFITKLLEIEQDYSDVVNSTTWFDRGQANTFEIQLKRKSKLVYTGDFPAEVVPDSLYIVQGEAGGASNISMTSAIAHDYHLNHGPLTNGKGPLVKLNANDPVCGNDKKKKSGGVVEIETEVAKSWVHYSSGAIQVTFKAEPDTKKWVAACHMKGLFHTRGILAFPSKTPFVFNVRPPKEYNSIVTRNGIKLDEAAIGLGKEICKKQFGLVYWMIRALHQSLGGNDQSYYPGLVIMHGQFLDLYSYVNGDILEGKGMGNGVALYTGQKPAEDRNNLLVHEAAHCLYLLHNFGSMKYMKRHENGKKCVMSYDKASDQHGGFCGKCLASLRGMSVVEGPLKDK